MVCLMCFLQRKTLRKCFQHILSFAVVFSYSFHVMLSSFFSLYSSLSNKRSPTIFLYEKNIPGPTQLLKTLRLFIFEKKSLKNWVKIEKRGYFQKLLYIALQKFQALR